MIILGLLLNVLFAVNSFAGACPDLSGSYGCVYQLPGQEPAYSVLKIENKSLSSPDQAELMQYSFDYTAIEGPADVIQASIKGEVDSYGWTTRCENDRLVSFSDQESATSEIYLKKESDHSISLIQTFNGKVTSSCPKL